MYNTFSIFLHLRWFGARRRRRGSDLNRQNDAVKSRLLQGTIATGSNTQSSHRSLLSSSFKSSLHQNLHQTRIRCLLHSNSDQQV